jgi:hypothetical protein
MAAPPPLRRWIDRLPAPAPQWARRGYRTLRRARPALMGQRPKGAVAMLHVGRSGSTVIGNMLNAHPEIVWDGELYHVAHYQLGLDLRAGRYGDWTRAQFALGAPGYYGFECKILPGQHLGFLDVTLARYLDRMEEIGVSHFVLLKRRNILRRMVSQYVGSKTKSRHIGAGGTAELSKIALPILDCRFGDIPIEKPLLDCLDEVDAAYALCTARLAEARFLSLVYEDDVDGAEGPLQAAGKICDLIGAAPPTGAPDLSKTNPFPLSEILSNFDAVADHLAGSRHAWMLDT